jgi:integron integrase
LKHPRDLGQVEIEAYLNHLASKRRVSASTQSSALNAITFLYRDVLSMVMPKLDRFQKIKRYQTIPMVMSVSEVQACLREMSGTTRLMAELIYGSGMRIGECVTLRVKDIDFDHRSITVRAAKGNKDRVTLLPEAEITTLEQHLVRVSEHHVDDRMMGNGYAPMPNALYKKYPSASREIGWQFVFPSSVVRPWRESGHQARWHCSPSTLRRAFNHAVRVAGIHKHVGVHTLRHSFSSHLQTTMICTHVKPDHKNVSSPLDRIKTD